MGRRRKVGIAGIACLFLLLFLAASGLAADPLDRSFGADGLAVSTANGNGELNAIARDDQGRLVTAGSSSAEGIIVQRFLADGSLDTSFGEGGAREASFGYTAYASAVAVQDDGKILAVGQEWEANTEANYLLMRYLPDGTPDPSFGRRGRVVAGPNMYDGEATAVTIAPDGKILVAGWAADTHFGFTGILLRFRPNGELDTSFSRNGYARVSGGWGTFLNDVAIQPDGRIVVAGEMFGRFMMLRMHPDGRSDTSFGKDGFAISDVAPRPSCRCASAQRMALLPGGRILLSGTIEGKRSTSVALSRYRPSGKPDRRFGDNGVIRTGSAGDLAMEDMAVRRDGRIVLAGYHWPRGNRPQVAALRYLPSGRPDPSFGERGLFTQHLAYESDAKALMLEPDGSAIVAGRLNRSRAGIHEGPGEEFVSSVLEKGEYLLMRLRR